MDPETALAKAPPLRRSIADAARRPAWADGTVIDESIGLASQLCFDHYDKEHFQQHGYLIKSKNGACRRKTCARSHSFANLPAPRSYKIL